ncbi:ABC transporter ATP-binding protein [Deinococcus aquiradiocola]|uniref:ABC transporter ATP-binding protein n=1 Tax=Deinococcus aquiradiocola TaxID=393059 RepID=A0A917UWB3_9DEIO|nr:ABC transporter ATP-binding protein [Deinococcus aquiradiocola]GGJ89452.1 ABC transporter ATP-binding protein [Deinococcus aquiradiocola]
MTSVPAPTPEGAAARPAVPTLALMRRLFAYRPGLFALNLALWGAFHTLPALFSFAVGRIFDRLNAFETLRVGGQSTQGALTAVWIMVGVFAAARLSRFAVFLAAFRAFIRIWYTLDALLRRNLLGYLLLAPGSRRLPDTPAEAISRFRDDVEDVAGYTEVWIDSAGFVLYTVVALTLMVRVDPVITLVVCAPLLLMVVVVQRLSPTIRRYRRRMREATARVTDFVGETFAAVSAVKLSGNEDHMVRHLERLGETRRRAALRDVLLTELIKGVNSNMIAVATGLVLLLGASRFRTGGLSIGDFVLFAALLPRLTGSMGFFGDMIARHRRTGVSFERMNRLLQDAPITQPVEHHDVHLQGDLPPIPPAAAAVPLARLDVTDLSAVHPNGRGLHGASFSVTRGEFVVVTGRIGSGKTTLLRALLGLIPRTDGEVRWNDMPVTDPASFFVPPRSAYTAQLPQLFSESLRENVLMGHDTDPGTAARLDRALHLAVMTPDLTQLGQGLDTPVGARGVKLSGGQVQRAAVARMLSRDADLLVFDDVSSALDAATEAQLWAGLFAERHGTTCLVVSHRRAALLRADRILLLEDGRLTDSGTLPELLERSAEMRELWAEDTGQA